MMPAWAFPLFGVACVFSFAAAFIAVRAHSGQRFTRVEPVRQVEELDEAYFLSDDGPVD